MFGVGRGKVKKDVYVFCFNSFGIGLVLRKIGNCINLRLQIDLVIYQLWDFGFEVIFQK